MYYTLKEQYILRGWSDVPFAVVDTHTGKVTPLKEELYQVLAFCNGKWDLNSFLFTPVHRDIAIKLTAEGVVTQSDEPSELFSADQALKTYDCTFMARAHWSMTGLCNANCRHCYMEAPKGKYGELSTKDCLAILDELTKAGVPSLSLTGGEPLVRADFWQLVDEIISRRIHISVIYTNGLLVNNGFLAELKKRNIKPDFSLSFDGVGHHDWIRGVDGMEEDTVRAITLLKKNRCKVGIETTMNSKNAVDLPKTIRLLADLKIDSLKISPTCDSGSWKNEEGKYSLTPKEIFSCCMDILKTYKELNAPFDMELCGIFYGYADSNEYWIPVKKYDGTEEALTVPVCGCAKTTMYIMADGVVLPCMPFVGTPLQEKMPNILNTSLKDILRSSEYLDLISLSVGDLLAKNPECSSCEHRLFCGGGCRADSYFSDGAYLGTNRLACEFFRGKWEERIQKICG